MKPIFLKAEWRKLLMINYEIDPEILLPFLPAQTKLDLFEEQCLVSVVGFKFLNTKIKGIKIPFHVNFEEVNLRFYVTHQTPEGEIKRGTSFIKEIVPKPAITFVANSLYKEKYVTMPMSNDWKQLNNQLHIKYTWGNSNSISCVAENQLQELKIGSLEEFITEHYWGYTQLSNKQTAEYGVEHPRWQTYAMKEFDLNIDFEKVYGKPFSHIQHQTPHSVLLAEGSEIIVRQGKNL